LNLREARGVIEDWRPHYNEERPHSWLGYLSPKGFLANQKSHPKWAKKGKPANVIDLEFIHPGNPHRIPMWNDSTAPIEMRC